MASPSPPPPHKVIPGTGFLVDGFRFAGHPSIKAYFLTHAHSDHYTGLSDTWAGGPIYCSPVTARLVNHLVGVPQDQLRPLELNVEHDVMGVRVTLVDANHCPGAVQLLFKLPDGRRYLHCGDMRYSSSMAGCPHLSTMRGATAVFLDTTYANPRFTFPTQDVPIQYVADTIYANMQQQQQQHHASQEGGDGVGDGGDDDGSSGDFEEGGGGNGDGVGADIEVGGDKVAREDDAASLGTPGGAAAAGGPAAEATADPVATMAAATAPASLTEAEGGDATAAGMPAAGGASASSTGGVKAQAQVRHAVVYLIQTYVIGKERILMAVRKRCGVRIYVDERKWGVVRCLGLSQEEFEDTFTNDPAETPVHVVGWGWLGETWPYYRPNYVNMEWTRNVFKANEVVGFLPSGWMHEMRKCRPGECPMYVNKAGNCRVHLVPYSEHSSFNELQDYVRWLRPQQVIPTVGVEGEDSEDSKRKILKHFASLVDQTASKARLLGGFAQRQQRQAAQAQAPHQANAAVADADDAVQRRRQQQQPQSDEPGSAQQAQAPDAPASARQQARRRTQRQGLPRSALAAAAGAEPAGDADCDDADDDDPNDCIVMDFNDRAGDGGGDVIMSEAAGSAATGPAAATAAAAGGGGGGNGGDATASGAASEALQRQAQPQQSEQQSESVQAVVAVLGSELTVSDAQLLLSAVNGDAAAAINLYLDGQLPMIARRASAALASTSAGAAGSAEGGRQQGRAASGAGSGRRAAGAAGAVGSRGRGGGASQAQAQQQPGSQRAPKKARTGELSGTPSGGRSIASFFAPKAAPCAATAAGTGAGGSAAGAAAPQPMGKASAGGSSQQQPQRHQRQQLSLDAGSTRAAPSDSAIMLLDNDNDEGQGGVIMEVAAAAAAGGAGGAADLANALTSSQQQRPQVSLPQMNLNRAAVSQQPVSSQPDEGGQAAASQLPASQQGQQQQQPASPAVYSFFAPRVAKAAKAKATGAASGGLSAAAPPATAGGAAAATTADASTKLPTVPTATAAAGSSAAGSRNSNGLAFFGSVAAACAGASAAAAAAPTGPDPLTLPLAQYDPVAHACWRAGEPTPYAHIVRALAAMDSTTKRLKITDVLVNMFRSLLALSPLQDLISALYLVTGRIAPEYEQGGELHVGGSTVADALLEACGCDRRRLRELYRRLGDLGDVAQALRRSQTVLRRPQPLTVQRVLGVLRSMAVDRGADARRRRQRAVLGLLQACRDGIETKYIVRTLVQNLRVGANWRSVLGPMARAVTMHRDAAGDAAAAAGDAAVCGGAAAASSAAAGTDSVAADAAGAAGQPLAPSGSQQQPDQQRTKQQQQQQQGRTRGQARGGAAAAATAAAAQKARLDAAAAAAAAAYHLCPNFDVLVPALVQYGFEALKDRCPMSPGVPVKPMLAKICEGVADGLQQLGPGAFLAEFKYDGVRAQIHLLPNGQVKIFSRNSEDRTQSFPDVVDLIRQAAGAAAAAPSAATTAANGNGNGNGTNRSGNLATINGADAAASSAQPPPTPPNTAAAAARDPTATTAVPTADPTAPTTSLVVDAEIVGVEVDPSGEVLRLCAFQELATRARGEVQAHEVTQSVCVFVFDLLYHNGKTLLQLPLRQRRARIPAALPLLPAVQRVRLATSHELAWWPEGQQGQRQQQQQQEGQQRSTGAEAVPQQQQKRQPQEGQQGQQQQPQEERSRLEGAARQGQAQQPPHGGAASAAAAADAGAAAEAAASAQVANDDMADAAAAQATAAEQTAAPEAEGSGGSSNATAAEARVYELLMDAINAGTEGLMLKRLDAGAAYEPSRRSESWIKIKRDYCEGLRDSLDLVPIGAWHGNGRKAGWLSPFLMAVWDTDTEQFQTVCRCMSGFTDAFYIAATERLGVQHRIPGPKPYYHSNEQPDVWFEPCEVWEIRGADLTISPVHTAAAGRVGHPDRGVGLRFPRFIRLRDDKRPEDATTPDDIVQMYGKQSRKAAPLVASGGKVNGGGNGGANGSRGAPEAAASGAPSAADGGSGASPAAAAAGVKGGAGSPGGRKRKQAGDDDDDDGYDSVAEAEEGSGSDSEGSEGERKRGAAGASTRGADGGDDGGCGWLG